MNTDQNEAGAKFLERDFDQCFAQMRHYDSQIWDICRFTFTSYTVLLGVVVGLHQFSIEKDVDLNLVSVCVLAVAICFGVMMYGLAIRNRVYYIIVTRYINEHRMHFLKRKPLGFANVTRMYEDPTKPPFFDWPSSQLWLSYIVSLLNGILLGALVYISCQPTGCSFIWVSITAVLGAILQILIGTLYLRSREGKSAMNAITHKSEDLQDE
jgi:uncharacterized membrane protein YjjB (DUF3815 family)